MKNLMENFVRKSYEKLILNFYEKGLHHGQDRHDRATNEIDNTVEVTNCTTSEQAFKLV